MTSQWRKQRNAANCLLDDDDVTTAESRQVPTAMMDGRQLRPSMMKKHKTAVNRLLHQDDDEVTTSKCDRQ